MPNFWRFGTISTKYNHSLWECWLLEKNVSDFVSLPLKLDNQCYHICTVENINGFSPLHLAIQEGHERIVELLVNFGADLLCKPPQSGLNATQLASKLGQDRIVKFLTFYCHKKKVPQQEIPGILDGPEKAKTLLLKAISPFPN